MSHTVHAVHAVGKAPEPAAGSRYYLMTDVASGTLGTPLLSGGVERAFREEIEGGNGMDVSNTSSLRHCSAITNKLLFPGVFT